MTIRVLVVDDSGFFRRRVTEMLEMDPRLKVVGDAVDGQEAVDKTIQLRPDVVTMDIEMPVLDGISAVRRIMRARPTPVLMFSSLTTDGAKATLDALDAGAVDYLPKRFEDISKDRETARRELCERVHSVGSRGVRGLRQPTPTRTPKTPRPRSVPVPSRPEAEPAKPARRARRPKSGQIQLVAIGTSTGGPVALQEVLTKLPKSFPVPILLVQHMPGSFTPAFAQRLDQQCALSVKEAVDGEEPKPGNAYLAPGGRQMQIERRGDRTRIRILDSQPNQNYKPCVDITFSSVAKAFPASALALVLTGMGADGREGARLLKASGSTVWAQDEATSVVYGMPAAVTDAGLADEVLSLNDIGHSIAEWVS